MAVRRVTVFGGSGFIGRHLVRRLAAEGAVVRVAVRDVEAAKFLKPMGAVGQIAPVQANLRHEESVRAAVEGVDEVVNLVGILYESGRQRFADVHARGAAMVALAAADAGVERLVQMSAIGADPDSDSLYARSKAAGEAAVSEAFPSASVVRPSIVFGPEDDFFNRFAALARLSPMLPLIDGGKTRFQPVFVGDVAEAITRILASDDTRAKTYELGGPAVYTFEELMRLMLSFIGRKRILAPLPSPIATLKARFLELLPVPPLTVDQVRLLKQDNVVSPGALTLEDLGITPTALEVIVPSYLSRFRVGGQFADDNAGAEA